MLLEPTYDVELVRQRKALSLTALAERAGISYQTARRAVLGLPTRPGTKQRIAACLELPPDAIRWGDVA